MQTPATAIAHVLWNMDLGGAERAVYQLVREQRRRGIHADVVVGSHAGYYGELCVEAGARVYELGQRRAVDIFAVRSAERILARYSVVHFHYPEAALIYLAARSSTSSLFYTHRAGIHRYSLKQLARYKLAGRSFRKRFSGLSANTQHGAAAAARLFGVAPKDIAVTYNGVDLSLLVPRRDRTDVLLELGIADRHATWIGVTGNLRTWKRIDRLLQAVHLTGDPSIRCLVIGDGPDRDRLESTAARLGIVDRVCFTGKKNHVGDYLQLLDIFVLPSGPAESFGNSAVEAMGVGIPTVVFADGGGLLEHVTDGRNGYVVDSTEELARRISDLAISPDLRRTVGSQARAEVASRYSLSAMVERYNEFYCSGSNEVRDLKRSLEAG